MDPPPSAPARVRRRRMLLPGARAGRSRGSLRSHLDQRASGCPGSARQVVEHGRCGVVGRRAHGQLKTTVLALLREAGEPVSARMLLERWPDAEPKPAFTTVITVLTRLQQAGAVERLDGGEARFRVRAVAGGVAAESMLAALLESADRGAALMSFAEQLDATDLDVLRRAVGGSAP
ncbi:hypothetical protein D1781_03985 [Amnibacterium setariae]|uniref:BlaI/MecI/CopY family transcriptional regulator n=1 Tax=Amnibacterium setariae TaxID=2306585 RepID=A0A3A1UB92_9MICO|nr:hypothetical protein D1781_03985 [Amnibacterium setariae]